MVILHIQMQFDSVVAKDTLTPAQKRVIMRNPEQLKYFYEQNITRGHLKDESQEQRLRRRALAHKRHADAEAAKRGPSLIGG